MKYLILVLGVLCSTSSLATLSQKIFESRYYDLLNIYIRAKSNSNGIYKYVDGREVNPETRFKTQAERDCLMWKAAKNYATYVLENFDRYEIAVKDNMPLFEKTTKQEWNTGLKDINRKLHDPRNKCY
ncbi:hypothetical protein BFG52_07495 [Acinetobacter larvae]|uniref:Uncharacterized protein n=2 Tax=Acinetobacter larvae TaxID=1789224 RepID=A0A1B2M4E4_9GAMM|nr:hypothetical protein BFG52_07495 [Acinetobacter larvae]